MTPSLDRIDVEGLKADERDAFEEWYCVDAYEVGGPSFIPADIAALRDGDLYGVDRVALNGKWYGWKARAVAAEARDAELIAQRAALVEAVQAALPLIEIGAKVEFKRYSDMHVPGDTSIAGLIGEDKIRATLKAVKDALSTIQATGGGE